jgi:hypothetical protein
MRRAIRLAVPLTLSVLAGGPLLPSSHAADDIDAEVTRIDVDDDMQAGKSYTLRVTVKNSGKQKWSGRDFALLCEPTGQPSGAQAQRNELRLEERIDKDLRPSDDETVRGGVTAPATPGRWELSCWVTHQGKRIGQRKSRDVDVRGDFDGEVVRIDGVPEDMQPGQKVQAQVTVKNTGKSGWSGRDFVLVCEPTAQPPGARAQRDELRLEERLDRDVPAGRDHRFSGTVTAPSTPGRWTLSCSMTHDRKPFTKPLPHTVRIAGDIDGEVVSIDLPSEMEAGRPYTARITVKNTGKVKWSATEYAVACESTDRPTGPRPTRDEFGILEQIREAVAPGASSKVEARGEAPPLTGRWTVTCRLVHQRNAFGKPNDKKLTVKGDLDADVTLTKIDAEMQPGKPYDVSVQVKNTGKSAWSGKDYALVCENTQSPGGAPAQRDEFRIERRFDAPFPPGKAETVTGKVEAPRPAGRWVFSCWMTYKAKPFGKLAPPKVVMVKRDFDGAVSAIDVKDRMDPGSEQPISVRIKNTGQTAWSRGAVELLCHTTGQRVSAQDLFFRSAIGDLAAGDTAVLKGTVTAPRAAGPWLVTCRLLSERKHFGELSKPVTIGSAGPADAAVLAVKLDPKMRPGQMFTMTVPVRNAGTTEWSRRQGAYELVCAGLRSEDKQRGFQLTAPVERDVIRPKEEYTFKTTGTAPGAAGRWEVWCSMRDPGRRLFGQQNSAVVQVLAASGRTETVPGSLPLTGGPGFRSEAMLEDHYRKHVIRRREFGETITKQEYLRRALALRDAAPGGAILECQRRGGAVARFDRGGKYFGVYDADGTIVTFFVPTGGESYFERECKKSAGR